MRVLYVAKNNETEVKGDVESKRIRFKYLLLDFMNNNFKPLVEEPITGLKIMAGAYSIHLLEGDKGAVKKVLKNLDAQMHGPTPFYTHAWVLHFIDE
jgi:hypothetical protein